MPVATLGKPEARVETVQGAGVEMNAIQNWITSLPWLAKELVIVAIVTSPVLVLIIFLKIIGA